MGRKRRQKRREAAGVERVRELRRKQNEVLLGVLEEEQLAENKRERKLQLSKKKNTDLVELHSAMNEERSVASERIMRITVSNRVLLCVSNVFCSANMKNV